MTHVLRCCVLVLAVCLQAAAGVAMAQTVALPKQGELMRSTTGRGIDSAGLASISVPLKKGAIYDVVRLENGNVVLKVEGQEVVVQNSFVTVTDKGQPPVPSLEGFVPGKVVIVSAKYSIEGNQPRNVKNNLMKLIPATELTAPLEIFVTDALSAAAQDQGNLGQASLVFNGSGAQLVVRAAVKNVLTVQYLYNGVRFTKQVPEGEKLVLP